MAAKQTVEQEIQATLDGVVFLFTWIGIMVLTNVIDCALTRAMGRKGLIAHGKVRQEAAS